MENASFRISRDLYEKAERNEEGDASSPEHRRESGTARLADWLAGVEKCGTARTLAQGYVTTMGLIGSKQAQTARVLDTHTLMVILTWALPPGSGIVAGATKLAGCAACYYRSERIAPCTEFHASHFYCLLEDEFRSVVHGAVGYYILCSLLCYSSVSRTPNRRSFLPYIRYYHEGTSPKLQSWKAAYSPCLFVPTSVGMAA